MKNIIIIIALCNIISLVSNQTPNIYIENYSGFSIACGINNRQEIIIPNYSKPIKLIDPHKKNILTPHQITDLTIRSDSYFSSPQPLTKYLNKISKKSTYNINRNKDAILIIKESGYLSDWNIKISWRNANSFLTSFSMETEEDEAQTKERQFQTKKIASAKDFLKLIEDQNLYGSEYAQKVKELSMIDYESLQQKNRKDPLAFIKLHSFGYKVLLTTINHIQTSYQEYLRSPNSEHTQQGNCTPEEVQMKIKELIDGEYQLFLYYKENGLFDEK